MVSSWCSLFFTLIKVIWDIMAMAGKHIKIVRIKNQEKINSIEINIQQFIFVLL